MHSFAFFWYYYISEETVKLQLLFVRLTDKMGRYSTIFCLGLIILMQSSNIDTFSMDFLDVYEVLNVGRHILIDAMESIELIQNHDHKDEGTQLPFLKRFQKHLWAKITHIDEQLQNMETQIDQRAVDIIDVIMEELPKHERLEESLHELNRLLARSIQLYKNFLRYNRPGANYSNYTRQQFAKECVDPRYKALPDILLSIHELVAPQSNKLEESIFVQLASSTPKEAEARVCNEKQSPQQLLYNLYCIIALTELRAYSMMQFSYTVLQQAGDKDDFIAERNDTTADIEMRIQETLRAVKVAMAFAPRDLWRCDPAKHEKDKTYTELTQLFQGYIVNEVDLNPSGTCRENCNYYAYTKVYGCFDNLYCSQQRRCNGKVLKCQYIDSDMSICPSNSKNRRYESIEYEDGRKFGNTGTCTNAKTKVDSWWRWIFWHCSYCMCYCDDYNSSSDRYFNLRDVTSDVLNNKVIIGMRLTKVNQIIHIQIQEAKLLSRAEIDNANISWKPVDNFSRTDAGVINSRDYHTITWEKRAIDLDDLVAPPDHLLTGVRFRMVGAHLNFEIRVTPFNFTTGILIRPLETSTWLSNDNTDFNDNEKRMELKIFKPDIPTRISAPSKPDSETNQFLNFGPTDLEKDAAQTTVPFLDLQPIETNPPYPLAGAGVFHKGRSGSGGYIALKVITYDFTNHIRAELPPPPPLIGYNAITID